MDTLAEAPTGDAHTSRKITPRRYQTDAVDAALYATGAATVPELIDALQAERFQRPPLKEGHAALEPLAATPDLAVGDDCDVHPMGLQDPFKLRGVIVDCVDIEKKRHAVFRGDSGGYWVALVEKCIRRKS